MQDVGMLCALLAMNERDQLPVCLPAMLSFVLAGAEPHTWGHCWTTRSVIALAQLCPELRRYRLRTYQIAACLDLLVDGTYDVRTFMTLSCGSVAGAPAWNSLLPQSGDASWLLIFRRETKCHLFLSFHRCPCWLTVNLSVRDVQHK